jgi:hypothetical protein
MQGYCVLLVTEFEITIANRISKKIFTYLCVLVNDLVWDEDLSLSKIAIYYWNYLKLIQLPRRYVCFIVLLGI